MLHSQNAPVVTGLIKPGSHMSPMIGESLSVIIQGENSQRILLISNHRLWLSPMSATYGMDLNNKPISGCARTPCDSLLTTSLLQVVNRLVAS